MRQLLILSGKGGTGKTTVATSFIKLAYAHAYADCDVEAPNLHLLLSYGEEPQRTEFASMPKASIDASRCDGCGICEENCRFDALERCGTVFEVHAEACEGCGLCAALCPQDAIGMVPGTAGDIMLYADGRRAFSTARLRVGAGISGKLVTAVKEQLKENAPPTDLAVIDGPPGIGCPVIASLAGVDTVLLVVEPTMSGLSDLERVLETVRMVGCRVIACINRFDLNPKGTARIERFCRERDIPCVGKIPYDPAVVQAVNQGLCAVDLDGPAAEAVEDVFDRTMGLMESAPR